MAKKQSFATQLAKGFVRSTVNQVGRQTGNLISNNMYGNAHSVPYRNAGGNNNADNIILSEALEEQTKPEYVKPGFWKYALWFALCFFFMPWGSIITFCHGLYMYLSKSVKCINYSTHEGFVPDARYKEGVRSVGQITVKNNLVLSGNDLTEEIVNAKNDVAKIYMIMGGAVTVILTCLCFIGYFFN